MSDEVPDDGTPSEPAEAQSSPGGADGADGADEAGDEAAPVLALAHVSKSFGAVRAVIDGVIELRGGEAHALLGENGAGKSTMVKMLAGVHQPDDGRFGINGEPVVLDSPAAAIDAGIAIIYQEPTLFPDLSVAENIFMGRQPLRAGRRIDSKAMTAEADAMFARLGVRIDPAAAQQAGDVLGANAVLMDAYNTDVRPLLAQVREELGLDPDPYRAYLAAGHQERIIATRVGGTPASW